MAHLWVRENRNKLYYFFARVFSTVLEKRVDIENEQVILNLIDKFQLDSADFISWKSNNQNCVNSLMDTALSRGIFGCQLLSLKKKYFGK